MLEPGQEIDVWVVEKPIGSGGMGSVYRCHNRHAPRILAAIKTLEVQVRKVPEAEARFIREAEILFSVDHPNVVKVRNVRLDLDTPYLEMEFVEGESLEDRLCRGPLTLREGIDVMEQLLDAIAYLHDKGIRHRDIKPSNVIINKDGRLKLVDFGLATEADVSRITRANTTFGTVSYAPPEWIKPDEIDPEAWDVYAAGVVFWECLTGRVAFPGSPHVDPRQQAVQIMAAKQKHGPLDPGKIYREDVRQLVIDMAHSDRAQRVQTARDALTRLRRLDRSGPSAPGVVPSDVGTVRQVRTPEPAVKAPAPSPKPSTPVERRKTNKTPAPAEPPAPVSRWGALAAAGTIGLAIAGLFVGGALSFVAYQMFAGGTPPVAGRDVRLIVTGLPSGMDAGLLLAGKAPSARDGFEYRFDQVPVGAAHVAWSVGNDCDNVGSSGVCPGESCPVWCVQGQSQRTVEAGDGPLLLSLELEPPPARDLRVRVPNLPADVPLSARLSDRTDPIIDANSALFLRVLPDRYRLVVNAGECPEEALGCQGTGVCPEGCASLQDFEFVLPAGEGEHVVDVPLKAPQVARHVAVEDVPAGAGAVIAAPPKETPKETPKESAPSKGRAAAKAVTKGEFATWLEKNPDWQREAAIAAGNASEAYLQGWSGASFPGSAGEAVTGVSFAAASAYCASRGGLADADSGPQTWEMGASQPHMEWRLQAGKPVWKREDGAVSDYTIKRAETNGFMGMRCAR